VREDRGQVEGGNLNVGSKATRRRDRGEDEDAKAKAKKGEEARTDKMTESAWSRTCRKADGQRQNTITRGRVSPPLRL
jgi:hypothetical protein